LKRSISAFSYMVAFLLAIAASAVLISLLRVLHAQGGALSVPGAFLFKTFLWSSFFIPVYLFVLALFLLSPRFSGRGLIVLNLFLLPFITASVFHKVVLHGRIPGSFLPDLMVRTFGRTLSAVFLFLIVLFELFLILTLGGVLRARPPADTRPPGPPGGRGRRQPREKPAGAGGTVSPGRDTAHPVVDLRESSALEEPPVQEGLPVQPSRGPADAPVRERVLSGQKVSPRAAPAAPAGSHPPRGAYSFPIKGLLKDYPDGEYWEIDAETRRSAEVLMQTLQEFKIRAEVTGIRKGPVITMFEILPSPGVKISRIVNLADNIALRLAASRVRIVAPIPGKHAVGIEVPNKRRAIVSFKEMVSLKDFQDARMEIPIALGKDISGEAQLIDLTQTPHLLIAGATGSGKSVCVNSIICSVLYRKAPEGVRLLLIDPKIVELKAYNDIPHLLTPVVTEPKKAFQALQYCIDEMERRYSMLDRTGARDIRSYNKKVSKRLAIEKIPYWVIVIDEFADLMATTGKEMEAVLARLAAMARAVGIHLVLATQRPSIDVITGLIKANIPSRIAFMVASKFDSRIIIDSVGAEKLLGQGDMLFTPAWDPIPVRIQGTYLSEEEVEAITGHARTLGEPEYVDEEMFYDEDEEEYEGAGSDDPLMDKAVEIVLAAGKASASYIQRRLKVGYNRAARMVEEMERMGIVGPAQGSKPRDIIHAPDRQGRS
jgi:S-DNA-T family DNA segregation ATPase FtsK/SpoIIIE